MVRWLFTMEYVGEEMWAKRNMVVKLYDKVVDNPFVDTKSSCGISKSDFDIMLDELGRKGYEV
jgi:hypothetical protein